MRPSRIWEADLEQKREQCSWTLGARARSLTERQPRDSSGLHAMFGRKNAPNTSPAPRELGR